MDAIVFTKLDNGNFHPFGMFVATQVSPADMKKAVDDYNNDPSNAGYLYFGFEGCVMYSEHKPVGAS